MSSGALAPQKAVQTIYEDALHHLHEPIQIAFLKNVAGGLHVGSAGLTSMIIAGGCPGINASNPGITHFIEGALFSTGLISVYFTGAELFTGYPMWLAITACKRKGRPWQYVVSVVNSLLGNLTGALLSASLFTYATKALSDEPYKGYLIGRVEETIVDSGWHTIFIKAVACGYLVTLAMLLGTQNLDGISKALALWLPFTLATSSHFPHTVEYMHLVSSGMMYGAPLSIAGFFWKCLLPIILGNTVGGALFTGVYHWWVYLHCDNGDQKTDATFADLANEHYSDEEDG